MPYLCIVIVSLKHGLKRLFLIGTLNSLEIRLPPFNIICVPGSGALQASLLARTVPAPGAYINVV